MVLYALRYDEQNTKQVLKDVCIKIPKLVYNVFYHS